MILGQNYHYVGTNWFFLDRVITMSFRDPGMILTWTMMLYSLADINKMLVSVQKDFCTPCHPSVCKPLLWSCLINQNDTVSEPLLPNSNGSELGESLAVLDNCYGFVPAMVSTIPTPLVSLCGLVIDSIKVPC